MRATESQILVVNDPAVLKLDDPIAVCGVCFRVRYLNDRGSFVVQPREHFHDFFALR
jgi:hypothetical protein